MRHRRRRPLDLLPLLDIFMVVLFVFATIQEGELGASQQTAAELRNELRGSIEALARAQQAEAAALSGEREARAALAQAREEQARLREVIGRTREALAQSAGVDGGEQLRRQEILAKLIDHFSVFEIEVDGELRDGEIVNHCCYRSEPLATAWRSCGIVPGVTVELRGWLADGGAGLVDALRRTRGGNALTIVRQSERAPGRIGRKLEEQLRERFPDHKVDDEGIAVHEVQCARPAAQLPAPAPAAP